MTARARMMVTIGLAVAGLLFAACAEEEEASGSCTSSTDCASGLVCVDGGCVERPCTGTGDCTNDSICKLSLPSPLCAPAQCGCLDCSPCPQNQICQEGACVPSGTGPTACGSNDDCPIGQVCESFQCKEPTTNTCTGPQDCAAGQVCDAGACRPCQGDECTPDEDCTVDGCETGFVCDPGTKMCVEDPTGNASTCGACAGAGECPDGWKCNPMSGGQFCIPPCTTGDDCETGWSCQGTHCIPSGNACNGCTATGCTEAGQSCNTQTGVCEFPKISCDACTYDHECGVGAACHKMPLGGRHCVLRCTEAACAAGSSCIVDEFSAYKVCEPDSGTCCVGPDCGDPGACDPACNGTTPHCVEGACVECTGDNHCSGGLTCSDGVCQSDGGCTTAQPHFDPNLGYCVQCLNDGHCSNGSCNTSTGTCEGDECAQCADPYPACTLVDGEYYCVQCTLDEHCGLGATCDINSYACQGGTVDPGVACYEEGGACDPGITAFNLSCDMDSGYCYDNGGGCDDVTAYCRFGNECLGFFEAFAGMDIPLPTLPGAGGATLAGLCECTPFTSDCPAGTVCLPWGLIMEFLSGSSGAGLGKNFCFASGP